MVSHPVTMVATRRLRPNRKAGVFCYCSLINCSASRSLAAVGWGFARTLSSSYWLLRMERRLLNTNRR